MKILSIDAEVNGLYGQIFAIGAIYKDTETKEETRYVKKVSIVEEINPWVEQNVLPNLEGIEILDKTVDHDVFGVEKLLLKDFIKFYNECKEKAGVKLKVIGHMVCPVEASIFIKARKYKLIEDFDGPYPLHDVASMLLMVGSDPTSVDEYLKECGEKPTEGSPHNPLYDCEQTYKAFMNIGKEQDRYMSAALREASK